MDSKPNLNRVPKGLLPDVFEFSVEYAQATEYSVRWLPGHQLLEIVDGSCVKQHMVSKAQWSIFWFVLKHVKVWKWDLSYCNDEILDGVSWHLNIKYRSKQIESYGLNAYPGVDGCYTANNDFGMFIALVNMLAATSFTPPK
jgi:hypothetical protein